MLFLLTGFDKKTETLFRENNIYNIKNSNDKNMVTTINQNKLTFNLNKFDIATKNYNKYKNKKVFKIHPVPKKIYCTLAHKYSNSETYTFEISKSDTTLIIQELN